MLKADFPEPFVPTVRGADDTAFAAVLKQYKADTRPKAEKVELLEAYLREHPDDPWSPSIALNLGLYQYERGSFSRAVSHLSTAWEQLDQAEDPRVKPLADRALGEYAIKLAQFGRYEELRPLLKQTEGRTLQGSATEWIAAAREGLLAMDEKPEISFLCGPYALAWVGETSDSWNDKSREIVKALPSTKRGTSLAQVYELSKKAGLDLQMAYREPGSSIITPAVTHWKVGHFAALLAPKKGLYPVKDDTASFNDKSIMIEAPVLDEEASGYYLVEAGKLPEGWRSVALEEGATVWGRGNTGPNKDPNGTGKDDVMCPYPDNRCNKGMANWTTHAMLVSLTLSDTPVGLSPAAFIEPFEITYMQRDSLIPGIPTWSNLGPKWTTSWTSYVVSPNAAVATVYKPGGGAERYDSPNSSTVFTKGYYSQAILIRQPGNGFRLEWPDGAIDLYTQQVEEPLDEDAWFLTSRTDAQGNTTTVEYDSIGRISGIRDAVGRLMTLSYELQDDPLKITKVTDPFGRSATFTYTPDGHLESVTDVLGLVSSYQYGNNDFINTLTTPYGTTTFTYGDISTDPSLGDSRFLQVVDPAGRTHRVESAAGPATGIPSTEEQAPPEQAAQNTLLEWRNTFYWTPNQLDATPDYSKATIYHFLHLSNATSRVLESVKKPLEARVFISYNNYPFFPTFFRNDDNPQLIARVLSDGSVQQTRYQYNGHGNVTQMTDPEGRVFDYTYAPNEIDLLSVTTGGQTLFSATYDGNHNITSFTDASGGSSTYTYNTRGQILTSTNPLGETTTRTYTPTGNVASVQAPLQATVTFGYDAAERVSSATDTEGYTVQATYDVFDRPVSVLYPDGTSDTLTYQNLDLVGTTDRIGRQVQMSYDTLQRPTSIIDGNGGVTQLSYGLEDGPITLTDPNGNITSFAYDLQQRMVTKQYADGASQTTAYEVCSGRISSITDALGQVKTYSYFLDNQLKSIEYSDNTPTVTFTNDTFLPRPLSMTDGDGVTTLSYVPVGQPGGNQIASISGPFGDQASFTHDIAGRVIAQDINGLSASVTFDQLWRPLSVTNPLDTFNMTYLGKTGQVTSVTSNSGPAMQYAYDTNIGDRRLLQIKNLRNNGDPLSQFDYSYDAIGQITQWVHTHGGGTGGTTGTTGGTTGTTTGGTTDGGTGTTGTTTGGGTGDTGGTTDGTGTTGTTTGGATGGTGGNTGNGNGGGNGNGNGNGNSGGNGNGTGNGNGNGNGTGGGNGNANGTGTGGGNGNAAGGGNGNANGNGTGNGNSNAGGNGNGNSGGNGVPANNELETTVQMMNEVLANVWGWDTSSWDTSTVENFAVAAVAVQNSTETYDFSYDNLSQLVGVNLNQTPYASYTFDPAGNMTSLTVNGVTTNLTYNNLNQTSTPGTNVFNPRGETTDQDGRTFEWDAQGRVIAIVEGNRRSEFGYNGISQRTSITEIVDGQTESKKLYWWLGGIVCERDGLQAGFPITKRYFGQGVLQGTTKLYYTTDHLGSVRALVDETGEVVADYRYSIYGERTKIGGDQDSDYGYAGLFHHAPSGLDLATYRLYDSRQRRFISRDPLGEGVDYNLYRYANNNPINFIDPSGLHPGTKIWRIYRLWKESKHGAKAAGSATKRSGSTLIGEVPAGDVNGAKSLLEQAAKPEWGKRNKGTGLEIVGGDGSPEEISEVSGLFSDCGKAAPLHVTDPKFADGATGALHGHPLSGKPSETGAHRLHVQSIPFKALIPGIAAIIAPHFMELRTLDPNMESTGYDDLAGALVWDAVEFLDPTPVSAGVNYGAGI